jgi:hypothetical protein
MTKISFIETENRVMNFNFRSMWENKIGPALVWFSDVLSWGLQFIACVVLTIAIFGVALPLMYIFWLNPLAFALWAHIFPKLEAQLFFERPMDGHYPNNMVDQWGTICVGIICWGHRRLHGWMPRYFAWYAKRHFIAEEPTSFSKDDVVRYLRTLTDGEKTAFFHKLLIMDKGYEERNAKKSALLSSIWAMRDMFLRNPYLEAKEERNEKFTVEEIEHLCNNANYKLLDAYMDHSTLSEEMLKIMVNCHDKSIQKRVYTHIIKHGVSGEFVAWANMQGEGASKLVDDGVTVYSQLVMVRQQKSTAFEKVCDAWEQYCKAMPSICAEAQFEFNKKQAEIFYETGHEMDETAVFHFFTLATKEKNEMAEVIFHFEGAKALKSDRIKTLVKSNYWLNCHALGMA